VNGAKTPAVHVDFQNADSDGRVRLNTAGALDDLERQRIALRPDLQLHLIDAELSTPGQVAWNEDELLWVAEVDWNDLIEPSSP
jgi:hypothetical protein